MKMTTGIQSTKPQPYSKPTKPTRQALSLGGYAPDSPKLDPREDLQEITETLKPMSVGLSCLIYEYSSQALEALVGIEGATNYRGFSNSSGRSPREDFSKFAMAFVKDDRAWITFRGSDDMMDWDSNLRLFRNSEGVHKGFAAAWNSLSDKMIDWVKEIKDDVHSIVLSGHSLGGAMAVLAADELCSIGVNNIEAVITIGAPRVGSASWVKNYNDRKLSFGVFETSLGETTHQIRVENDIVPKVGPRFLGYRHCGNTSREENHAHPGFIPNQNLGSMTPLPVSGFDEFLRTIIQVAEPVFGPIDIFFKGLAKARDSGLSHRNIRYRQLFPMDLAFSKAINKSDDVLKKLGELLDQKTIIPTFGLDISSLGYMFSPVKSKGKSGLVFFVGGLAILFAGLLAWAIGLFIWAYIPSFRIFLIIPLIASLISFVLRTINAVKGDF